MAQIASLRDQLQALITSSEGRFNEVDRQIMSKTCGMLHLFEIDANATGDVDQSAAFNSVSPLMTLRHRVHKAVHPLLDNFQNMKIGDDEATFDSADAVQVFALIVRRIH